MGHISRKTTSKPTNVDLSQEEYCIYMLISLFNAHYLPWLKDCYSSQYAADFNDRFVNLVSNLELAFPHFPRRKNVLIDLARKHCFHFKRKLLLTIDSVSVRSVASSESNDELSFVKVKKNQTVPSISKSIQVCILTKDTTAKDADSAVLLYNCFTVIKIEPDFSVYLELPIEMNDSFTKVYIEFLYNESEPNATTTNVDQVNNTPFHVVKECEISGYAGHYKSFTIEDTNGQEVNYRINLRWEIDTNSIWENIERPDVINHYFSGALLSLGTYFFRFYSTLYHALLVEKSTQVQAIKSFGEVAFLIGSNHKSKLCPPVLHLLQEKILSAQEMDKLCCSKVECSIIYRLVHAAFIIFDQVSCEEQKFLLERLCFEPFNHVLRFNCWTVKLERRIQLHKLIIRRFYHTLKKKADFGVILEDNMLHDYILNLMIDSTKRVDLMKQLDLQAIQKESVLLFVKYFKAKLAFNKKVQEYKEQEEEEDENDEKGKREDDEEEVNYPETVVIDKKEGVNLTVVDVQQISDSGCENLAKEPKINVEVQDAKKEDEKVVTKKKMDKENIVAVVEEEGEEEEVPVENEEEETDIKFVQKIITEDLSEKFNLENMFSPENCKQTTKLFQRLTKQFYKHKLIKTDGIKVEISF